MMHCSAMANAETKPSRLYEGYNREREFQSEKVSTVRGLRFGDEQL